MSEITLEIDGREVKAEEGMTILEAAKSVGINIPALCYHEAVSSFGACRLCSVEITSRGRNRIVTSCNYLVEDGLIVNTGSADVIEIRKMLCELLLARCPNVKVIQDLAREYGVEKPRFKLADEKCILCGLCTRICEERLGISAINFVGRGIGRQLATPYYEHSDACIGCGSCAYICPTGAITLEDSAPTRKLFTPYVTMEFKLKKCKVCGNYFATEKELDYIAKVTGLPAEALDKCPTCRARLLTVALGMTI
jgi:NADH dehydrogenase/NADH:ubiquinone oxidoreductase subunit G